MSLSDRKKRILKAIVDEYIENAEPVGSKIIAARSRLDISPATIRNEMSELEELGFLEQPHVSAGRVPSTAGYRLYVNELMQNYALSPREADAINSALNTQMRELERMLREFGRLVSQLTNYTTYTLMPAISSETVKTAGTEVSAKRSCFTPKSLPSSEISLKMDVRRSLLSLI